MYWSELKDWDREAHRLEVANASGVALEEVHLPGDNDPELNIVLRDRIAAQEEVTVADVEAEVYGNARSPGDTLPSLEQIMFFDAMDGSIDGNIGFLDG
jgi:hypothetical protein